MGDVRCGSVAVCWGGRKVSCMLRWFEVVCLVFSALLPRPTECGTWPTNILARLETPTSSSSPAASLFLLDESCKNLFHLTSSASCDVLADYSHRVHRRCVHQLLTRPRSTRQQAHNHFHMVLCRVLLVHLEQQRQLEFVLPSHRGRRWPTPMHHQRLLVVQSSSCTAGPRKAAARHASQNI